MNSDLIGLLERKKHYQYADKLSNSEREELRKINAEIARLKRELKQNVETDKREIYPTLDDALQKINYYMAPRPKQPRKALPRIQYIALKKYILERDKWCVFCGRTDMLTPAHIKRRSAGGHDAPNNMVVACQQCHDEFDQYKRELPFTVIEMLEGEPETWEIK